MASIIITGLYALSQDLTPQEALSGVFGSISLATWIFLLVGDMRLFLGYEIECALMMFYRSPNSFSIIRLAVLMEFRWLF
jgi:hypothetical protein